MPNKTATTDDTVLAQHSSEILESISDAFYAVDRDWRFTYLNRKAEEWWGRSRDSLIGRVYWDEFPQAVGSEPYKAHLQAARSKEVVRLESVSPILGRWVDISIYPAPEGGLSVYFRDINDKKLAEERLRKSEARYRTLFEAIDAGFCVVEMIFDGDRPVDYRFLEANPAFEDQTGLHEAIGRTARELVPELEDHWFEIYGRVAMTGEPARFENGSKPMNRWFDVHALRVGAPEERRVAILFNDITERRRSELALAESEARFRLMADAVPQIIWITDAEGRVEFFNRQWSNYTGVPYQVTTAAEVAANHVHPDDGAATMAAFEKARSSGKAFNVEHRIRSASGEYRWFLVRAEPHRSLESGEIVSWFGASIDIHDRKLAEAALMDSELRLRELNEGLEAQVAARTAERNMLASIVETTDVLVMACDLDYNILALNAANADEFERIYGIRPKAGDNLIALLSDYPEHQEQVRSSWGRGMRGEQLTFVEDYGDPNRVRPYYEVRFSPLLNEAGEQVGAYQFVTDVTERLRSQAQLADAQEALRQSQKMEAMGQLTGGVAHDFNNLLTPIIGSLDMLQRRAVGTDREQRLIAGALQSAERAKTLVQRLLAFARRQPLQATAVDVSPLLESMADLVASTSGPQVQISVEAAANLRPANGDLNQLELAVLNLAVNARDAMPDGGTITLSAENSQIEDGHPSNLPPGDYVRLSVTDTGLGMDDQTLSRAVEPFFSTKGIGKGTGLGLSMVHGLASQLGGSLTLSSRPGLGTRADLWLPVSAAQPARLHDQTSESPAAPKAGTVLLVDDEEAVRSTTADMLIDLGYSVTEAVSAREALKLLESGEVPDLLVTDHLMPGMTGTDLAREVRTRLPQCPVLLVSGFAEVDGVAPDLPRLTKPFRQEELASALSNLR